MALHNLVGWKAVEKGLALRFAFDPDIPKLLRGDPLRLKQILINYLNNAIKFTERGEVVLRVRVLGREGRYAKLRFEVQDSGIGIAPDSQEKLFKPFWQADSSTSRKFGGSGLGLVICRRLAILLGGEVGASSEPGNGSTFWLEAPFEMIVQGATSAVPTRSLPERLMLQVLRGKRVLLVEDHAFNIEVVSDLLESVGMKVYPAHNGIEALAMLRNGAFEVVLMDMQMPLMDGLEATRHIRAELQLTQLPVIAVTANAYGDDRERCLEAGMNDYLVKPFHPDVLFAKLAHWLGGADVSGAVEKRNIVPSPQSGLIDMESLAALVGHERGAMRSLLDRFLASTENDICEIEEALRAGDTELVSRLAHHAKSPAGLIGASGFYELYQELERENDVELAGQIVERLHALKTRLEDYSVTEPDLSRTGALLRV